MLPAMTLETLNEEIIEDVPVRGRQSILQKRKGLNQLSI